MSPPPPPPPRRPHEPVGGTIGQPPPPVTEPPEPPETEPPPSPHLTTPTGRASVRVPGQASVPVPGQASVPGQPSPPSPVGPVPPPPGPAIGQIPLPPTGHAPASHAPLPPTGHAPSGQVSPPPAGQLAPPSTSWAAFGQVPPPPAGQATIGPVATPPPGQAAPARLPAGRPATGHAAVPPAGTTRSTAPTATAQAAAARTATAQAAAARTATAQAAATAQSIPAPRAAALPPAPAGPFPAAAEAAFPGAPPVPSPTWRIRRHRGLDRLSVGRHAAPIAQLDELQLTTASFGLLLGRDQAGSPVTVRMFRPAPLHAVLLGSTWAARLVTHRALHFGARLVVVSRNPAGWIDLGRRATGRTDRVAVVEDIRSPATRVASADTPVLRVAGLSAAAEQDVPVSVLPQWNTRLSVQPQVTPDQLSQHRARQLAAADIVLIQRLSQPEAAAVSSVLKLNRRVSDALPLLRDDMLAVVTRAGVQYAWLRVTEAEQAALGRRNPP